MKMKDNRFFCMGLHRHVDDISMEFYRDVGNGVSTQLDEAARSEYVSKKLR